jgi:hypothetical protein
LASVYRIFLLLCSVYSPKGIGVEEGEFDVLYGKGIARLSLMQYEQLEQGDREMYMDVSDERVVGFRKLFIREWKRKGEDGVVVV